MVKTGKLITYLCLFMWELFNIFTWGCDSVEQPHKFRRSKFHGNDFRDFGGEGRRAGLRVEGWVVPVRTWSAGVW